MTKRELKRLKLKKLMTGTGASTNKNETEELATMWANEAKKATTQVDRDGCNANAAYYRKVAGMLKDGGMYVTRGW